MLRNMWRLLVNTSSQCTYARVVSIHRYKPGPWPRYGSGFLFKLCALQENKNRALVLYQMWTTTSSANRLLLTQCKIVQTNPRVQHPRLPTRFHLARRRNMHAPLARTHTRVRQYRARYRELQDQKCDNAVHFDHLYRFAKVCSCTAARLQTLKHRLHPQVLQLPRACACEEMYALKCICDVLRSLILLQLTYTSCRTHAHCSWRSAPASCPSKRRYRSQQPVPSSSQSPWPGRDPLGSSSCSS